MRVEVRTGPERLLRGLLSAVLALLACRVAYAQDMERHDDFRLFFPRGSATLVVEGEYAIRNRAAVDRMAAFMPEWAHQSAVRFIFVARRAGMCSGVSECSPEQIMFQRFGAAAAQIVETARKSNKDLPLRLLGQAFDDEFSPRLELALNSSDVDMIELRTYVGPRASTTGDCSHAILLFDPGIPPTIGASPRTPVLPVVAGTTHVISPGATVQLSQEVRKSEGVTSIWEMARDQFCRPPASFLAGGPAMIPDARVTLYTIVARAGEAGPRRLSDSLASGCRSIAERPPFLANDGLSKDIGNDAGYLPPGGLRGPEAAATTRSCRVTFVPLPAFAAGPSR